MILVTGAAGFIGSAVVWYLNECGITDIVCTDKMRNEDKWKNLRKRTFFDFVDRDDIFEWLDINGEKVETIVHMGACSSTTEKDVDYLIKTNFEFSKKLYAFSVKNNSKFIYASSAATYGIGENGYSDDVETSFKLKPLNPYGFSKQLFDIHLLKQKNFPKQWVGLKFFNVYGPNEYHKKRMASVIFHAFNQVKDVGFIKLFKSHKPEYKDGGQLRDFIYVKDITKVIKFFIDNDDLNGIYNLGTGSARSFEDLGKNTMISMGEKPNIEFIDMPLDIRDKYQYYTQAEMEKLSNAGYNQGFYSLEEGIKDYVQEYLCKEDKYL